jgi:choline dehydrogenase-like flavoprotein
MADRPADPPRARSDPCGHSLRAMPTLTRREFTLSASALAAATLLSGCGGGSDTDGEHVVVVHGIAGLAAARRLADEGVRVTVLEARERIGGQVWTCEVRSKLYEAGYETPLRQTGMPWVTTTLSPPGRSVAPCPPTKRTAWRHSPCRARRRPSMASPSQQRRTCQAADRRPCIRRRRPRHAGHRRTRSTRAKAGSTPTSTHGCPAPDEFALNYVAQHVLVGGCPRNYPPAARRCGFGRARQV